MELAEGAANCDRGAVRDADADEQNHEEHGGGSGRGVHEEVDQDVIQAHGKEYEPRGDVKRGYERLELRFGARGESGMGLRQSKSPPFGYAQGRLLSQEMRERWGTRRVLESKLVFLGGDDPGDHAVQASRAGGDGSHSSQRVS